ncbi:putative amino acid transport protein ABC superfamily [Escherichia coli]|nr:putative amino acid transport protein ABC superfamily [Escherichia coli]
MADYASRRFCHRRRGWALPPLSNSFISLVKDTSLAATIQVPELFRQAQLITSRTLEVFTMYPGGFAHLLDYGDCVIDVAEPFENQLNRQGGNPNECH